MYKITKNIMKSPDAMNNRGKICRKGKTLCVIGVVTEDVMTAGSAAFSEDTLVFKRE